jgi:S-adenosylmethionine synthetase
MELNVGPISAGPPSVELVEHKGIGHPDTICDALAERLSVALCRHYLDRFGAILHHNVDKALLWGGAARPAFGGGEVIAPMEIYLAGRAVREVGGAIVPVEELVIESARAWLAEHLRALDPERHVRLHCLVRPGSADLVDLYQRQRRAGAWLANDTSLGAGFAPLSPLESTVLGAAAELRRMARDPATPEVGEDVKVMGIRRGDHVQLTVACAFVGRHLEDLGRYVERLAHVGERVASVARGAWPAASRVEVEVNAADDIPHQNVYLTVTGTSAEAGDDGQVGRGNRVNGLITPYRPMTLEAAAGKNPVTHVGKLYNLAAHRIAADVAALPGVAEAQCYLVSRIGRPVQDPEIVDVRLRTIDGRPPAELEPSVAPIVAAQLGGMDALAAEILEGKISVF